MALNLLAREWFNDKDNVNEVLVPEFWDVTFIRQLFLGVQCAKKPFKDIQRLVLEHPELFPKLDRSDGDRNIYSHAATRLSTNIKNHLRLNLPKVIKRYIHLKVNDKDDQVNAIYQTFGWPSKGLTDRQYIESRKVRVILGLEEEAELDSSWLKKDENLPNMLKLFVHVNRCLDQKLFNILPICRIKPHFITIDTSSMLPLLKEMGLIKTSDPKKVDCEALWESFIKVSKVKTSRNTFTGTIDTDGLAINIHFERLKLSKNEKEVDLQGKRLLAIDPGRVNIFTIVEKKDSGEFKNYVLTKGHYYMASGITKAKKKTAAWNKSVKNELTALSLISPKSVDLNNFLDYLATVKVVQEKLWDTYLQRKWRDQTLRLYGGKKRTFSNFFNSLKLDTNTIVAFGSAKFAPTGKGELSVPTTRAYKELSYRCKTILIDEFRTSKVHWEDDTILQTVAKKKAKRDGYESVRGLLWCCSTKFNKFVNRDINAAINIWRCGMMYPQRPESLKRTGQIKIVQRIGKIIPK